MYYEGINVEDYPHVELATVILKNRNLDFNVHDGNYNYIFHVILKPNEMFSVAKWCEENLKDNWLVGSTHSGICNEKDALAFILRWT